MSDGCLYEIDITEIDGFDNLHHAEGILKEAQARSGALYGAEETHFLVNGSTAGILSAISGCTKRGGRIVMARNCHKAAYHACALRELSIQYVYPAWDSAYGLNGSVTPTTVREALKASFENCEKAALQAVFVTSPTYDGIVSDIAGLAQVCHEYGVPLIVDEAHGAHFGFHERFPQSAVRLGADVVIQSLHKTMPCLTQTALLHINGGLADREKIRHFLSVYQTSSPSYLLMAAMDSCVRLIEEQGKELFSRYADELFSLRQELRQSFSQLQLVEPDDLQPGLAYAYDASKLLINAPPFGGQLRGKWLTDCLRKRFSLELEMAAGPYALAMTSVGDDRDGYKRLFAALQTIDKELEAQIRTGDSIDVPKSLARLSAKSEQAAGYGKYPPLPQAEVVYRISDAEERPAHTISLSLSAGAVAGEYLSLYPPGTPLIVPGERIPEALPPLLLQYLQAGFSIEGLRRDEKDQPAVRTIVEEDK